LALLNAHVNLCCTGISIEVDACMFEHLVSIGNKLQLFFFNNTSMVLLDFQP